MTVIEIFVPRLKRGDPLFTCELSTDVSRLSSLSFCKLLYLSISKFSVHVIHTKGVRSSSSSLMYSATTSIGCEEYLSLFKKKYQPGYIRTLLQLFPLVFLCLPCHIHSLVGNRLKLEVNHSTGHPNAVPLQL